MATAANKAALERAKLEQEIALLKMRRRQVASITRRETLVADEIEAEQQKRMASSEEARQFSFYGSVNSASARLCMEILGEWSRLETPEQTAERPFCINICSPGGAVFDGLALIDYIRELRSNGYTIDTFGSGMVASMAGVLLQTGETRALGRHSYLMIHEVSSGAVGKIGEIEDEAKFIRRLNDRLFDLLAERSPLEAKKIRRKAERTDWWLDADEALEFGFIDAIR